MKTKRTLAILLLLAMLTVSASSCAEKEPDAAQNSDSSDAVLSEVPEETVPQETVPETEPIPELPGTKFNGEDFIILVNNRTDDYHSIEFAAEEMNGVGVNDAVFTRNQYIEDTYDVNLINTPTNDEDNALRQNVKAGIHAYDIALIGLVDSGNLALEKHLIDFGTLPYLYLDGSWWDQNATADLSLANRKYMTIGDMNINDKDMTWCMFYDKQLAVDYQLPDLYQLASDQKWTFDVFRSLCANVTEDLNGDGKYTDVDRYAHVTVFARSTIAYMYSMNAMTFTKDADDLPVMDMGNSALYDAYEVARSLFWSDNMCHDIETMPKMNYPNAWRRSEAMFGNKQILFYAEAMQNAERFRGFDNDFGILPLPSGTEGSYGKHMVWKEAYVTVAPVTLEQNSALLERAGILLEAIQRASTDTVLSAYYEKALKGKFSRDDSSSAMIDIIFDNRYYDIGTYYGWGDINNTWMSCGKAGNEAVASELKSKQKLADRTLAKTISSLTEDAKG